MISVRSSILAAVVACGLGADAAGAQIMSNPAQWYINNQIYSTRVFNSAVANSMLDATRGKGGAPAKKGEPATDVTAFRESPNSPLPSVLSQRSNGVARDANEARQLFASYIELYKKTASTDGFPANDLAYAFEYFVVNNFQIYHDLVSVPYEKDPWAKRAKDGFDRITAMSQKKLLQVTPGQERAVYQQFRERLAGNASIRAMTDGQKQESAELMATMLGINFAAYIKGLNEDNETLAQQAREMAREGLEKLLGVPIARIKITNNGLEL